MLLAVNTLKRMAARWLPARALAAVRKRHRRRAAAARLQARQAHIATHGTADASELADALRALGVRSGGVLLVQSSFNDLFTFSGRPIDLLNALRALVGPDGTLLMPAYTVDAPARGELPLDVASLPTYTGIVNELFRRSPGVLRSLHPRHSLCGEGPLAAELLDGHERLLYADGPGSPFDRLRQRDDAQILTLGLPPAFTSFLHWVEDIEPGHLPFSVHQKQPKHYVVRGADGRPVDVRDMQVRPEVAARIDLARLSAALGANVFLSVTHRGIACGLYAVKPLSRELLALRDKGIFHYH